MGDVVKRFSLLRRHRGMERAAFLEHYERVHGPLASAQPGFRQFTYRYVQNHVLADMAARDEPPFDGISVTYQKPRADYRRGFFQHPDYANVRPDEEYLFDLGATVSLLAGERVVVEGDANEKAILLVGGAAAPVGEVTARDVPGGVRRAICNRIDTGSVSALGTGMVGTPYRELWEIWFASTEERARTCAAPASLAGLHGGMSDDDIVALAVREVTFISGVASRGSTSHLAS